jgi:murein DD-endopeptidase MepM/ murein hydrolase activator NlpD
MILGAAASSFAQTPGAAAATANPVPNAIDVELRARSIQPGELLVLRISVAADVEDVRVTVFGKAVPAFPLETHEWEALAGVDLDQRPGRYTISVEGRQAGRHVEAARPFTVAAHPFPTRRLNVLPDYVNPPPEQMIRINRDSAFLRDVYAHGLRERQWSEPFVRPVPGQANSVFGTRSIYNGEARSPHAGADFLSPAGTPILAPNAGRIVCARDLFFTGNTVIIDHGLGLFSLLAHLSQLDVHEGDKVLAGQTIGLVGATGRVTGPHLHWALSVNGARVDPLSALALLGRK